MQRIKDITMHPNYWVLRHNLVAEFKGIREVLYKMSKQETLSKEDEEYITRAEEELEKLSPGIKKMFIDGEWRSVETLYLKDEA